MSADPSGESGETPPTAEISTSIVVAVLVRDLDDRPDAHVLVRVVLDRDRVIQPLAQRADPRLEQTLLVLRRVVLEVLRQVAELARRLDRLHGGLAARPFELGELGLEGGALLGGQVLGSRLAHWHGTLVASPPPSLH